MLHPSPVVQMLCSPQDLYKIGLLGALCTAEHFSNAVLPSTTAPVTRLVIRVVAVVAAWLPNFNMGGWGRGGTVGWNMWQGFRKGKTRKEEENSSHHSPPHITMNWLATTNPCFSPLCHYVLRLTRPVKTVLVLFSMSTWMLHYSQQYWTTILILAHSWLPVWVQFRWNRLPTYLPTDGKQMSSF